MNNKSLNPLNCFNQNDNYETSLLILVLSLLDKKLKRIKEEVQKEAGGWRR